MITSYNNTVSQKPSVLDQVILQGVSVAPILKMVGTGSVTAPKHSWIVDRYADPADNANPELTDLAENVTPTKSSLENYAQIVITEVGLTEREIEMSQYGPKEWPYQVGKRGVEHIKDVEYAVLGLGNTSVFDAGAAGNATSAPRMAGFFHYVPAANRKQFDTNGDGTGAAQNITYDRLHELLEPMYLNGAMEDDTFTMLVGTKIKHTINGFGEQYFRRDNGQDKYDPTLWTLATDFGDVKVRLHRLFAGSKLADKVLVGQFSRARILYVPNRKGKFQIVPTSKTAKFARYTSDLTLEVKNPDYFACAEGLK